jgi:hypothetical protein
MAKTSRYSVTYTNNTLYTKGSEFIVESTGEAFIGQYHIVDGVAYTGKPKTSGIKKLIPGSSANYDTYTYDKSKQFKSRVKQFVQPKFFRPAPTPSDYEVGFIQRYIVSHNLDTTRFPIEIGVSQANTYGGRLGVDSGIWMLHRIKWVIVGSSVTTNTVNPASGQPGPPILSVEDQNRRTLEPIIRGYPMMEFAFRNYTEFAQSSLF